MLRSFWRQQRALLETSQDAGRGLEEERIEVVEPVGKSSRSGAEGARPDDDACGKSSGGEEVLAEGGALGLGAGDAVTTDAAGGMMGHGKPVAGSEVGDAGTDFGDFADDFVAEHRARLDGGVRQLEEIGAAESAPAQTQQQLARSGNGVGKRPPKRLAERVDRHGVHGGVSFHQMERRIHRRFPRRIELRFWRPGEVQAHTAYTSNISKSGLFLNSAIGLEPGERLRLEIVDREGGFVAEGRVARVHRVALALRQVENQGVGVRFLPPEELVESLVPLARQPGASVEPLRAVPSAPPAARPSPAAAPQPDVELRGASDPPRAAPVPEAAPAAAVAVRFSDPASFLSTFHRDISAGGVFVSTPDPLPLQATVWIDLELPIAGEPPRRFAGRVVQRFEAKSAGSGGRSDESGMAVHFLEPEKVLAELRPLLAILRR